MTDILVDYQGNWGLGDALCSDPMMQGLVDRHGPDTRIWLRGRCGNVIHNPLVAGMARFGQAFDHTVEVQLFSEMDHAEYERLEAMPSLIQHMCSYAGIDPGDRCPELYLHPDDFAACDRLPPRRRPRIAICADHSDSTRHWPVERWRLLATMLHDSGADIIGIGERQRLNTGTDLVGELSMRETAAILTTCDLYVGNNSAPLHYAQAAGVPAVALFSVATPQRFIHPGAQVHAVQAKGLPCLNCMTHCFAAMQQSGCIAAPRGRCMTDIRATQVTDAISAALRQVAPTPRGAATAGVTA